MRQHENCNVCKEHPLFDLDDLVYVHGKNITKEQILKNQESYAKLITLFSSLGREEIKMGELYQAMKTVERVIKEFDYYDVAFKKHKDIDDFKIAQVLSKIMRGNGNEIF